MWFIDQFENGQVYDAAPVYHNIPLVVKLRGPLNIEGLTERLRGVLRENEILRTRIVSDEGRPFQQIEDGFQLNITQVDYRELAARKSEPALIEEIANHITKPFRMSDDFLWRAALYAVGADESIFAMAVHHILADRVSIKILFEKIFSDFPEFEFDKASEPETVTQFVDFSEWQREMPEEEIEYLFFYWKRKFSGAVPALELPSFRRETIHRYQEARLSFSFPDDQARLIGDFSVLQNANRKHVFFAGMAVFLAKYAGQDDIVIGTVNDQRDIEGAARIIGPVANLVAVRCLVDRKKKFAQILEDLKSAYEESLEYGNMPFDLLVSKLQVQKDMSRTALFDVLFQYEVGNGLAFGMEGASACLVELNSGFGKYDFNFLFREGDVIVTYNALYYTEQFVADFIDNFQDFLTRLIESTGKMVQEIPIQSDKKSQELLRIMDASWSGYPKDLTVIDVFEEQVALYPGNIAVKFGETQLTYAELHQKSRQLSRYLQSVRGIKEGDLVAIVLHRSELMIIAALAVLMTGAGYVPIDPDYPNERIDYMISDSGAVDVLYDAGCVGVQKGVQLPDVWDLVVNCKSPDVVPRRSPSGIMYVIYTSGSTGRPKGVMIEHRNVVNLLKNDSSVFEFKDSDVWIMAHSFCFDFSIWEIFGALLTGAKLIIPDWNSVRAVDVFCRLVRDERVTILNQTPGAFYHFADEFIRSQNEFSSGALRYIIFGGEKLAPALLRTWVESCSPDKVPLVNMYGITETTVHVTWYFVRESDVFSEFQVSKIGKPIPGMRIYVLDQNKCLLPRRVRGEIYVGGNGVSRGYINNEVLSSECFIANPFRAGEKLYRSGDMGRYDDDYEIEYVSRKDDQVKIRGYRIELGEIEQQLEKFPGIKQAVALVKGENNSRYIALYYKSNGASPDEGAMRDYLAGVLPNYMLPRSITPVRDFNLTTNGKVDKKVLSSLPETTVENHQAIVDLPENSNEEILLNIWKDVLNRDSVGTNDDFFLIGGNSMLVLVVAYRLRKRGYQIDVPHFYRNPTIKWLASKLKQVIDKGEWAGEAPTEDLALTPFEASFFRDGVFRRKSAHSLILSSGNGFDTETLVRVNEFLQNKHPFLRVDFETGAGIKQRVPKSQDCIYDLPKAHGNGTNASECQIGAGLVRLLVSKTDYGEQLEVVLHDLLLDRTSWKIVLNDMGRAYQYKDVNKLDQGDAARDYLFPEWVRRVRKYAEEFGFESEIQYWYDIQKRYSQNKLFVASISPETGSAQNAEVIGLEFHTIGTRKLFSEVKPQLSMEVDEIVLSALAIGFVSVFGITDLFVDNVKDARELLPIGLDLSETIGPFSWTCPLFLQLAFTTEDGIESKFNQVRTQLRDIPAGGTGYELLKWVGNAAADTIDFSLVPPIKFTYLGILESEEPGDIDILADEFRLSAASEDSSDYKVSVETYVLNGSLNLSITYDTTFVAKESIIALKNEVWNLLNEIIHRAVSIGAGDSTIRQTNERLFLDVAEFIPQSSEPDVSLLESLSGIWSKVLSLDRVDVDDNLFHIGGQSVISLFTLDEIYRQMQLQTSLSDIFNYPTIRQFIAYAKGIRRDSIREIVILNKPAEVNNNVLFIPPADGLPMLYKPVADRLEGRLNCYAVLFKGFYATEHLYTSYEMMSKHFANCIDAVVPEGLLTVVGYSWSGSIAFEVVKKLEALGRKAKLVVIDFSTDHRVFEEFPDFDMYDFERLFDIDKASLPPYYRALLKRVALNNNHLFLGYRTQGKLRSDILAIEARSNANRVDMRKWEKYTDGEFLHRFVEGNHWSALDPKNSDYIASYLINFCFEFVV